MVKLDLVLAGEPLSPFNILNTCSSELGQGNQAQSAGKLTESHSVVSNSFDPMDYTFHGILQARILECVAFPFSRGSSQPRSPTLQADSLPPKPSGKPKNTGVGSLALVQRIFLTQGSNRISCVAGRFFTNWATREAQPSLRSKLNCFLFSVIIKTFTKAKCWESGCRQFLPPASWFKASLFQLSHHMITSISRSFHSEPSLRLL